MPSFLAAGAAANRALRRFLRAPVFVVETDDEGHPRAIRRERAGRREAARPFAARATGATTARRGLRAVVELAPGAVLRRTVTLPAAAVGAARGDIDRLLAFEVARVTPFRPERAAWRHDIVARDAATVTVELTVAPVEAVEAALAGARSAGIVPIVVCPADTPEAARGPRDLARLAGPGADLWTGTTRTLAAACLLAALAAHAAPILGAEDRARRADERFAALGPAVEEAKAAVERERLASAQGAALQRIKAAPSAAALLLALTRALPDDAYLGALQLTAREAVLEGFARSTAPLPRALEAVPGVAKAEFRGGIARDPRSGLERFQFALSLAAPR